MQNQDAENRFAQMLKRVLKPLIKFLLKQGITYSALQEVLKSLYVEVAVESGRLETKRLTDSRISLLTGIHRKEVKRLRENLQHEDRVSFADLQASLSAAVMAKWLSSADYVDEQGQPLAIIKSGPAPSFEALVYSVSKDKHYRSLLDDWLAQGVVVSHADKLALQQFGFVPSGDEAEKLYFAGKNIGAHIETVIANLQATQSPMFERAVFYQNLPTEVVAEIEVEAKRRNLETLTVINELAAKAKQTLPAGKNSQDKVTSGFHVGAYFLREDSPAQNEDSK